MTPVRSRLVREARDLALLALAGAGTWLAVRVLAAHLPARVWWPALTGGALLVVLACRTPSGSTTVRTAVRAALAHPVTTVLAVLVVLAPWAWQIVSALIVVGAKQGVEAAIGGLPTPSVPGVRGWLSHLVGGGW